MSSRSLERFVWPAVLVLGAAIRLGVFWALPDVFDFTGSGRVHGSDAYDAYARNLLATGVYGREPGVADAAIPPLYSVVLAAAYAIAGRSALVVAVLHTACDLLSMVLLRRIAIALFGVAAIGTLAAAAMAVYPYLVFQTLAVNDSALAILQLHLLVWLFVRMAAAETPGQRAWLGAAAGLLCGLAVLTRPVIWPLLGMAAVWWALQMPVRRAVASAALAAAVSALVVGAWTWRNARVYGVPVLIATNGGSNFWQGNNPRSRAYLEAGYDVQWIPAGPLASIDHRDPRSNGAFLAESLRFLRAHPAEIPGLAWTKLRAQWSLDIFPRRNPSSTPGAEKGRDRVLDAGDPGGVALSGLAAEDAVSQYSQPLFDRYGRLVHRLYWGTALALACAGAAVSWRAWRRLSLIALVQLNLTAAYVVFHPSTRYRLPGDPLLLLLSAAGALALVTWRSSRPRTPGAARRHAADVHDDRL
jgi:4-amino-4-deoxy-L-arabinose transferase-like glycosyltransferase